MTIDERLEALTQSVELLSQMHQDNERRHAENTGRFLDMFERLTHIAESHDARISGLEGHKDSN